MVPNDAQPSQVVHVVIEQRHLGDVTALATSAGFRAPQVVPMPANNLSVVFRPTGGL